MTGKVLIRVGAPCYIRERIEITTGKRRDEVELATGANMDRGIAEDALGLQKRDRPGNVCPPLTLDLVPLLYPVDGGVELNALRRLIEVLDDNAFGAPEENVEGTADSPATFEAFAELCRLTAGPRTHRPP